MQEDHLRKVQYDEEKYQALFRDKDDKAKEYQNKMEDVSRQHVRNVRMID